MQVEMPGPAECEPTRVERDSGARGVGKPTRWGRGGGRDGWCCAGCAELQEGGTWQQPRCSCAPVSLVVPRALPCRARGRAGECLFRGLPCGVGARAGRLAFLFSVVPAWSHVDITDKWPPRLRERGGKAIGTWRAALRLSTRPRNGESMAGWGELKAGGVGCRLSARSRGALHPAEALLSPARPGLGRAPLTPDPAWQGRPQPSSELNRIPKHPVDQLGACCICHRSLGNALPMCCGCHRGQSISQQLSKREKRGGGVQTQEARGARAGSHTTQFLNHDPSPRSPTLPERGRGKATSRNKNEQPTKQQSTLCRCTVYPFE